MSLAIIDIDHFKGFNDRHGHQVGDKVLRTIAVTIAGVCRRPADFAARYGGEEFAVILADTDPAGALSVGEAIRAAVEELEPARDGSANNTSLTVSVGVATFDHGEAEDEESLLRHADDALFAAKRAGRNRVCSGSGAGRGLLSTERVG